MYSVFLKGGERERERHTHKLTDDSPQSAPQANTHGFRRQLADGGANTADGSREGDEAPTGTAVCTCECVSPP